ncbi:MAG: TerB family tellurite resistance protein [Chitinophagaceae bacterium]|nr:TerB family tellurite resistance protein [Chitinophagaceae bacterium]
MAKDYTKYSVEGVGENLSKSGLVNAVVTHYAKKNNCDFPTLLKTFPDELQGKRFVVKKLSEVKADSKKYEGRYFTKDPIKLSDKEVVVVCNQWGSDNIQPFIDKTKSLGYTVEAISKDSDPMKALADLEEMLANAASFEQLAKSLGVELDEDEDEDDEAEKQNEKDSKRPKEIYGLTAIAFFYMMVIHNTDNDVTKEEFAIYSEKLLEWDDENPEFVNRVHNEVAEWYNSMESEEEKQHYMKYLVTVAKDLFSTDQLKAILSDLGALAQADGDFSNAEAKVIGQLMEEFGI